MSPRAIGARSSRVPVVASDRTARHYDPTPQMHGNVWDYPRATLADLIADLDASGFGSVDVRYQHRLGTLFSPNVWRLISNGVYDMRALRRLLRRMFLRRWNAVAEDKLAGRYVIRAVRGAP